MSSIVKVEVDLNDTDIVSRFTSLCSDESVMLQIHNLLAQMCDPYVPMETGNLAQTLEITPEYVRYISPYAHYQYTGEIYGPNYPIIQNGVIVGWRSPPKKSPTGRAITYSTEQHPLATSHWDRVMIQDKGEEFSEKVTEILKRRAKELYG